MVRPASLKCTQPDKNPPARTLASKIITLGVTDRDIFNIISIVPDPRIYRKDPFLLTAKISIRYAAHATDTCDLKSFTLTQEVNEIGFSDDPAHPTYDNGAIIEYETDTVQAREKSEQRGREPFP